MNTTTILDNGTINGTLSHINALSTTTEEETDTSDNSPESSEEGEESKRHRTSPRTKAFDEVIATISTYIKENGEGDGVASDLRAQVEAMRDAGPPVQAINANKRHYVGISHTGALVKLFLSGHVSKGVYGKDFSHIYGPFHTKNGAMYVVSHGVRPTDPQVF